MKTGAYFEIDRNRADRFHKRDFPAGVCVIGSKFPLEGPQVVPPRIGRPITLAPKYIAADHSQELRYSGNWNVCLEPDQHTGIETGSP